jgi:hypothetical protein
MTRSVIEATVPGRTLHRGCQRLGGGPSGAMSHEDDGSGTNALSRMSTCRTRGREGAMGLRGGGSADERFIADVNAGGIGLRVVR